MATAAELECVHCHAQRSVELTAEEFRALATSWKVQRSCDVCGSITAWTFAEPAVGTDEQLDFWDWIATNGTYFCPPSESPEHERRQEPRVAVHVPLRIFTQEGKMEDVLAENISRSGFCFISSQAYQVGQNVRVSIRPPGSGHTQIKTATFVRVSALPGGRHIYGARILR